MSDQKPKRVQLSRRAGWRKPEGAVVVARPSRWGNPYAVERVSEGEWATVWLSGEHGRVYVGEHETREQALEVVLDAFRDLALEGQLGDLSVLAGRDLACWCPLDQPCHADVLLRIANDEER